MPKQSKSFQWKRFNYENYNCVCVQCTAHDGTSIALWNWMNRVLGDPGEMHAIKMGWNKSCCPCWPTWIEFHFQQLDTSEKNCTDKNNSQTLAQSLAHCSYHFSLSLLHILAIWLYCHYSFYLSIFSDYKFGYVFLFYEQRNSILFWRSRMIGLRWWKAEKYYSSPIECVNIVQKQTLTQYASKNTPIDDKLNAHSFVSISSIIVFGAYIVQRRYREHNELLVVTRSIDINCLSMQHKQ